MNRILGIFSLVYAADGFTLVLLPLLALQISDSALFVSVVHFCRTSPWLLLSLPVGKFIDMRGAIFAFKLGQYLRVSVLTFSVVYLSFSTDNYTAQMLLLVAAFFVGVGEVVSDNASQAMLPQLFEPEQMLAVNSKVHSLETLLSYFVAPPVAAFLFADSLINGLYICIISYAFALVIFVWATKAQSASEKVSTAKDAQQSIWAGWRILRRSKVLNALMTTTCISNFVLAGLTAILPFYIIHELGEDESLYGMALSVYAVGFVISANSANRITQGFNQYKILQWIIALFPLPFLIVILFPHLFTLYISLFILGLLIGVWGCITVTYRQTYTPPFLLGRVNASFRMLSWGAMPLGALLAGLLSDRFNVEWFLMIALVMTLPMWYFIRFLNIHHITRDQRFLTKCSNVGIL
ncbi:MFS transporter [Pseudoalteromonas sp. ASV78]|uniref:MFS transporter n=1 Tax=Pseudoalteromonas sp. ASV78 TaxID=3397851 RepID=UPI0039FD3F75